jgi:hypothetical protein
MLNKLAMLVSGIRYRCVKRKCERSLQEAINLQQDERKKYMSQIRWDHRKDSEEEMEKIESWLTLVDEGGKAIDEIREEYGNPNIRMHGLKFDSM